MHDQTSTEDRTLTEQIRASLTVAGFGAKTSEAAAQIAAAAVRFYQDEHAPQAVVETYDDGIDQGVSRLTLLGLLAGDQFDDERIETTPSGLAFPYRGQRVAIDPMPKRHVEDAVFAEVRLLHSLATRGARYAVWLVPMNGNVAHVLDVMCQMDVVIDAERAEVFA
jgi:hypothetical protein